MTRERNMTFGYRHPLRLESLVCCGDSHNLHVEFGDAPCHEVKEACSHGDYFYLVIGESIVGLYS